VKVAVHAGQLTQPVPGGIGRYVRRLLGALPAAGADPVPFGAGAAPDGVPGWHDLGWPPAPWRYEAWHRLRRPVVRVPGDLVHATSLAVPPPGRRPLVVTVHDLVVERAPELLTPRGVAFHRRGLDLARREAAAVVVPSAATAADLAGAGFVPDRIHVAAHGIDPVPPDPGTGPDGQALQRVGVRGPFALFVGTVEPRKGIADAVTALGIVRRRHPDLSLVVVGAPGWGEPPDLDRPGVVVLGPVGDDVLDACYRRAVALVLPSRYEGFGLPVAEAMGRGCPVVVSDTPALVEVAGGAGDVVPGGDVDGLAAALAALVDDPAHRAARAAAGRRRAAAFTWAGSAAAHVAAYRAALAAA
jgi:glycosyltransferase involved in cell wall biosynthesis